MPTDASIKSRAFRVTREYATYKGEKPVQPKSLQTLAPKAGAAHGGAAPASPAAAADGKAWTPSVETKKALMAAGRTSLPKPALRLAGAVAGGPGAARVLRAVHATEKDGADATLALGVAIGVVEAAVRSNASVLVVASDAAGPLAQQVADKVAAFGGAEAAARTTCLKAATDAVPAVAAGVVLTGAADVLHAAKAKVFAGDAAFDVCVLLATGTNLDALRSIAKAKHTFGRVVVVAPSVKIATSVTVFGAAAAAAAADEAKAGASPSGRGAAAASSSMASAAAPSGKTLRSVEMNYFVAHGIAKFNLLQSLVNNSGASKRIIVRCATKEVATFYCDVLMATNAKAMILTDVEDDAAYNESDDDDGSSGPSPDDNDASLISAPMPGLPAASHLRSVKNQFEAARGGCVLLSAFGVTSPKAEVIFELDPPGSLSSFVASVMDATHDDAHAETHIMVLDPSAHEAAVTAMKHAARALIAANPPPADASSDRAASPKKKTRSESDATAAEASSSSRASWRFKRLPALSASSGVLQGNKLKSLSKKLFSINNKGFQAYRAFVHYYALLRPVEVFDVYRISLDKAAEQFGLEDTPLLDLRTKSNQFRPKEDYGKYAAQRERRERREFRQFAADNLHAEVDEDELAAEAAAEAPVAAAEATA